MAAVALGAVGDHVPVRDGQALLVQQFQGDQLAGTVGFIYLKAYGLNSAGRYDPWILIDDVKVTDIGADGD